MFVSKYPEWVTTVVFKDGHDHHFDGAKDMFKLLADPARYDPGHQREDIVTITVIDHYGVERIDTRTDFYVVGSDVMGPMGHELVPLASKAEAEEFLRDHQGQAILTFDQVNAAVLTAVEVGAIP